MTTHLAPSFWTPDGPFTGGSSSASDATHVRRDTINFLMGAAVGAGGAPAMMVDFTQTPNGPFTQSNGRNAYDPFGFLDAESVGGSTQTAEIADGEWRLRPDDGPVDSNGECTQATVDLGSISGDADDTFFAEGIRHAFLLGPLHLTDHPANDGIEAFAGFLEANVDGDGLLWEVSTFDMSDGTPSTRHALYLVTGFSTIADTLYTHEVAGKDLCAGLYIIDRFEDGRWSLHRQGTTRASGDGLPPLSEVTVRAPRLGQRGLTPDGTAVSGLWIPWRGRGFGTPRTPFTTIDGAAQAPSSASLTSVDQITYALQTHTTTGSPITLDASAGRYHRVTMTDLAQIQFSFPEFQASEMIVEFDGDQILAFLELVYWPGGTVPTHDTLSVYRFWSFDGGDVVYGEQIGTAYYPGS